MTFATRLVGSMGSCRGIVLAGGLASMLASCAPSTPSVDVQTTASFSRAPDALTGPCDDPVGLPQGDLRAGAVARLWARDRLALAICVGRQAALADHVRAQEAAQMVDGMVP